MLELAAIPKIVELFKSLIDLRDKSRADKQAIFEKIIQPLFEALTPIVSEYQSAMVEARGALQYSDRNLEEILQSFQTRRDNIVMARNTVVGLISGVDRYREPKYKTGPFEDALDSFVQSAVSLFWASDSEDYNMDYRPVFGISIKYDFDEECDSGASIIINALEEAISELIYPIGGARGNINSYKAFQRVESLLDSSIRYLEGQWMKASMNYARLRSLVYKM